MIGCSSDDSTPLPPEDEGTETPPMETPPMETPPMETPPEETPPEEGLPPVDCAAAVGNFDTKPSDFVVGDTIAGKFIRNETDQVQAALDASGEGGVVWLEDEDWLIDRDLIPKFNNTKIVGGTLKRADTRKSILTAAVQIGDTVLTVENPEDFYPGLILSVADGLEYEDAMFPQVFVATVEGNNITLGSAATKAFEPGAVVFSIATLIKVNVDTVDGLIVSNVTFDGNEANNSETFDWRLNSAIGLSGKNQFIECSSFVNSPCESIIGHNVTIRETSGENLFGSFFHASGFESGEILLENCTTNDTNKVNIDLNGHNEGTITLSNNSGNLTIRDCSFTLGGEAAWGFIGEDDCFISATNSTFTDHPTKYFRGVLPPADCFDDSTVTYNNVPD